MSLRTWLRLGWFVLVADIAYWLWQVRQPEEQQLSGWHGILNIVLYYGGAILFLVLVVLTLLVRRDRARARP